ncbi:hypothetical protein KFK09_008080 [Dendrobium nobile]|uniref:Reverse transcriptase zinc-binding domain-containing protein n=1 Tax=Dendrobium nobile TaxID=94219 RepID=A0A8T3BYY6_DENNO|nr:hypothetical protein KFK09_008080 [Dendrobium nobile]
MFPKAVTNQDSICQILSILNITSSISYLGIPLAFRRLKVADYLPFIDSIDKKLLGWKANLLSLAGRLQFLKFTMINSIAYWIRGGIMPKTVLKHFKKISSRFLFFGDIGMSKKIHMVAWDRVFLPTHLGGLGLHSFLAMQYAFNCSIIMRMYNSTSLLSDWLSQCYISPWRPAPQAASIFWKSVCSTALNAKANFNFIITPNARIAVHWDHWCYNGDLDSFSDGFYVLQATNANTLIRDLIRENDWSLPISIPECVKLAIRDIKINMDTNNCIIWKNVKHNKFSDYINAFHDTKPDCSWSNLIWHKKYALRYTVYTWLALVGGLKTAEALLRRNISVPSTCSLCHVFPESSSHLFFECSYSYDILLKLIPSSRYLLFKPSILQLLEWISEDQNTIQTTKNYFSLISCCSIYFIWIERNARRFGNKYNSSSTTFLRIKNAVPWWIVFSGLFSGPPRKNSDNLWKSFFHKPAVLKWTHLVNDATPKQAPIGWSSGNHGDTISRNFCNLSPGVNVSGSQILLDIHYLVLHYLTFVLLDLARANFCARKSNP